MNPYKDRDLRKFINDIPEEEIEKRNIAQEKENKRIYKEFIEDLEKNKCFLCKKSMDSFDKNCPCFHWFTYPNGIKKKYFKKYLENPIGFFKLDSYFRWLANYEQPIGNINDLKSESSRNSYFETTYIYKNIDWAFSVKESDLEGHPNSRIGSFPHYHLQMKIDGKIFLKFNDFHIPFSDEDLFIIELTKQAGDRVKTGHSFGQGIGIIEDKESLEIIDNLMEVSDDYENATFKRDTIIKSPEEKSIPGETIQKALDESKITKEPVGKILKRLLSDDFKISTTISPGQGVPKMIKRNKRRNNE